MLTTPNKFRFIIAQYLQLFILFVVMRAIFFFFLFQQTGQSTNNEIIKAIYLGIKFDFKLASLCIIPFAIIGFFFFNFFKENKHFKTFVRILLTILYTFLLLFYVFDFGHYDYLATRIDSTVLRFLDDIAISSQMMMESYPVAWGTVGLFAFIFVVYTLTGIQIKKSTNKDNLPKSKKRNIFFYSIISILIIGGIYGNLAYFPLRWSQAMFSKDKAINSLALNPVLYFFDSFKFRNASFDIEKTKESYKSVADYLNIENNNSQELIYKRSYSRKHNQKPNIVIVLCESMGASQLGTFGNPMHPTPNIDTLINKSLLFNNFYVQGFGTARSVWASLTGLPDVSTIKTASRNPFIIDQKLIFDQFDGYNKYYIIGGNANWANIRALFKNNIAGLTIFEEGTYPDDMSNEKNDVWGINDYTLFNNADKIFDKSTKEGKPFIAFLQSASNHRPYTIGDHDESFKVLKENDIDMNLLTKAGFLNIDQLNALRYMDYNIGHLMQLAKESDYYDNTIFMFFGDHNARTLAYNHCKYDEFALGLNYLHVPLIIHSPKYIKAKVDSTPASLIDVFPTAADIAGIDYTNYTLGRSLLDTSIKNKVSFIYPFKEVFSLGLVGNDFYMEKNMNDNSINVYNLKSNDITKNIYSANSDEWDYYKNLLDGMYQSTLYLMYNNKKEIK